MTYDQIVRYYGRPAKAAAAVGLDRQVLNGWKLRGGTVPIEQQIKFELATKGDLRADLPREIRTQAA